MNDLKLQDSDRASKPSALFRYRKWILFLAMAALAVILALYSTKGYQQRRETAAVPSPSAMLVSPVSPLSPVSSVSIPSKSGGLNPIEIQTLADEGIRLYQSGNYTEALKLFNAVIDGDPSDPRAYDARGTVYSALNDYGQAMADYNQAIKLNPSFAQAYYNRGRLYSLLKQYDEALSDLEKSSELDAASFGYRANGNIGLIYYRQGKYDEALKAYAASIAKDGTKADVFFLRGETYTALGQYEAAIADYQSAVARFSRYDLAYQSLGYAYYKTGKNDKAIEELKRAIEIAPDSPGAHFYLALVDLATGDLGGATASMSQAVDASSKLPQEDQEFLYARVTTDLKTFAKENPDRAATVESMLKLMPQPQ